MIYKGVVPSITMMFTCAKCGRVAANVEHGCTCSRLTPEAEALLIITEFKGKVLKNIINSSRDKTLSFSMLAENAKLYLTLDEMNWKLATQIAETKKK